MLEQISDKDSFIYVWKQSKSTLHLQIGHFEPCIGYFCPVVAETVAGGRWEILTFLSFEPYSDPARFNLAWKQSKSHNHLQTLPFWARAWPFYSRRSKMQKVGLWLNLVWTVKQSKSPIQIGKAKFKHSWKFWPFFAFSNGLFFFHLSNVAITSASLDAVEVPGVSRFWPGVSVLNLLSSKVFKLVAQSFLFKSGRIWISLLTT